MLEGIIFLALPMSVAVLARMLRSRGARRLLWVWSILPMVAGLGFLGFWAFQCDVDWVKGNLCSQAPFAKGAFAITLLAAGPGIMLAVPVALISGFLEWKARRNPVVR